MDNCLALRVIYSDVLRSVCAITRLDFANLCTNSIHRWDSNYFMVTLTYQLGN